MDDIRIAVNQLLPAGASDGEREWLASAIEGFRLKVSRRIAEDQALWDYDWHVEMVAEAERVARERGLDLRRPEWTASPDDVAEPA